MEQEKKNKSSLKLWLTIGGIALAVILAAVLILMNRGERKNSEWAPVIPGENQQTHNGENQQTHNGETLQGQDGQVMEGQNSESAASTEGNEAQNPNGETLTGDSNTGNMGTNETRVENTDPIATVGDGDPYEECLVSAMIVGISMQYSDYEFLGIYTASETPISAHDSSAGAYVIFNGDGEKRALKAVPLSGERAERGTADIYVAALGYAAYDLVDPESVPVGSLKEHKLEDLVELIGAYSLVSIIER